MPQNPVNSGQITVAATPTLIASANNNRTQLSLNNAGGATVFLGNAAVTTTTGLALANNAPPLQLSTTAAVYAVVATGTNVVSFLES